MPIEPRRVRDDALRFLRLVAVFYSAAHVLPALALWAAAL